MVVAAALALEEARWMDGVRIRSARRSDRGSVDELLRACELPLDGLDECWANAFVALVGSAVAGSAALEHHGPDAVLRSVAVDSSHRGCGIGEALVRWALHAAHSRRVRDVYLLTETAADFFPRFGFHHSLFLFRKWWSRWGSNP